MDLSRWAPPQLDEEILAEQAPVIRAEILRRLEGLWTALGPWVDGREDQDGVISRPDARLVTAALTCLRQLQQLARLDQPRPSADKAPAVAGDVLAKVMAELGELEARTTQG